MASSHEDIIKLAKKLEPQVKEAFKDLAKATKSLQKVDMIVEKMEAYPPFVEVAPYEKPAAEEQPTPKPDTSPTPAPKPETKPEPTPDPKPTPTSPSEPSKPQSGSNPLSGLKLYVHKTSVDDWVAKNPTHAKVSLVKEKVAGKPMGIWISSNWDAKVKDIMAAAESKGEVPTFIVYNSIKRDLGSYSAGGAKTLDEYLAWLKQVTADVGNRKVIYIMEPDCLPHMPSMSAADQKERVEMLQKGIAELKKNPNAIIYLDAGHSKWLSAQKTADLLKQIGHDMIALNTSNRRGTDELTKFAEEVNKLYPLKGVVLDTSRNAIPHTEWCDPKPEGVGEAPTTKTDNPLIHAYLWLKIPGEADGCIAKAGQPVPERIIMVAENAVK